MIKLRFFSDQNPIPWAAVAFWQAVGAAMEYECFSAVLDPLHRRIGIGGGWDSSPKTRWWFHTKNKRITPTYLGKWSNWTRLRFFNWVGWNHQPVLDILFLRVNMSSWPWIFRFQVPQSFPNLWLSDHYDFLDVSLAELGLCNVWA